MICFVLAVIRFVALVCIGVLGIFVVCIVEACIVVLDMLLVALL